MVGGDVRGVLHMMGQWVLLLLLVVMQDDIGAARGVEVRHCVVAGGGEEPWGTACGVVAMIVVVGVGDTLPHLVAVVVVVVVAHKGDIPPTAFDTLQIYGSLLGNAIDPRAMLPSRLHSDVYLLDTNAMHGFVLV